MLQGCSPFQHSLGCQARLLPATCSSLPEAFIQARYSSIKQLALGLEKVGLLCGCCSAGPEEQRPDHTTRASISSMPHILLLPSPLSSPDFWELPHAAFVVPRMRGTPPVLPASLVFWGRLRERSHSVFSGLAFLRARRGLCLLTASTLTGSGSISKNYASERTNFQRAAEAMLFLFL